MSFRIAFTGADVPVRLPERRALKQFISESVRRQLGQGITGCITYIFCSDTYLLSLNRNFLGHDEYTDIITFPLTHTGDILEAEIYISTDRVKENAEVYAGRERGLMALKVFASAYYIELHRVMFHGALHLLGYNDDTPAAEQKMRRAENLWLRKYASFIQNRESIG
ncbi:MAG: rRNA maturation RNase YbeY [Chitinophagales bacterium]|nr:rRNA maturation RNase YbeY [Chitinophagales bacterium]MDW8418635.1 rRNA maturation RNase YbeY [Chitinophagales bacterium]